jgi:hypothetical protein
MYFLAVISALKTTRSMRNYSPSCFYWSYGLRISLSKLPAARQQMECKSLGPYPTNYNISLPTTLALVSGNRTLFMSTIQFLVQTLVRVELVIGVTEIPL